QDVGGLDVAVLDGHARAFDLVLPAIQKVKRRSDLFQVKADISAAQARAEFGLISLQKIEQAAIAQFHGHHDIAAMTPDFLNPHQVRMAQLSDDLNGTDFLRGGEFVAAGEKFECDDGAARPLGFPDAAETASATEAAKPVAGADFLVKAQRRR